MIHSIQIIHNPNSGNADHSKELITQMITKYTEKVHYVSTKSKQWDSFELHKQEPIFLAGGDGTVRKVFKKLLEPNSEFKALENPIMLCPVGKANNIAKTLNIPKGSSSKIKFNLRDIEYYCCGKINNTQGDTFFIESLGFGVFTALLLDSKTKLKGQHSSQVKLQLALHKLIKKVDSIKSVKLKIKTDKLRIKGDFVLAEVMKIKHMGPNLLLSPSAEIGAPYFHLVLVPKQRRMDFSNYLRRLLMGVKTPVNAMNFMIVVKASKLRIKANVSAYHMDDELVEDYKGAYLDIQVQQTKIPFVKNIQFPSSGE